MPMGALSCRRKYSSTAFFSHSWTTQPPAPGSATRTAPESSRPMADSTALRTWVSFGSSEARFSQACSTMTLSCVWSVTLFVLLGGELGGLGVAEGADQHLA